MSTSSTAVAATDSRLPSAPLTSLVGREREIAGVCALLGRDGVRLLTLSGPGGVGKTRLAITVAEQIQPVFDDGVIFVPLQSLADPNLVPSVIMQTLGIGEVPDQPQTERLIELLRDRRILIVLDNVEHLLPAAGLIGDLLAGCPGLSILTTSRTVLQLYGEHVYLTPPLTVPDAIPGLRLEQLGEIDAVRLFVERAMAARSDFRLTQENAPAIAAICARLDGLPLAIELVAARIKVLSAGELLARIDLRTGSESLTLLTGGPRDAPLRHQTMSNMIQWSYDLLIPAEQRAFRQLSVFSGGWAVEAAEAVIEQGDILEELSALIDKSLVQRLDRPGQPARYGMLEPIRQFALGCLAETGEEATCRQRHAEHFLGHVEQLAYDLDGPDARLWHERIDAEHDNLRGALRWLRESGQVEFGLLLAGRLGKFWDVRGYGTEGLGHLDAFLSLPGATRRTIGRATALNAVSWLCHNHGDPNRILPLADEACSIFKEHGHQFGFANALLGRGIGRVRLADDTQAEADWKRALPLFQETGRTAYVVRVLTNLAWLESRRGDFDRSRAIVEPALTLARAGGHRHVTALALGALGAIEGRTGDDVQAAARYRERIGIYHELVLPWLLADSIEQLAGIAHRQGHLERAARLLGAAAVLRERTGTSQSQMPNTWFGDAIRLSQDIATDPTIQAAWMQGRALSIDELVEYAMIVDNISSEPAADVATSLTRRELDVLSLVADGKSNQEIAEALYISPHTVATHVANIMNKLGAESRTAAATHAIRHGLI